MVFPRFTELGELQTAHTLTVPQCTLSALLLFATVAGPELDGHRSRRPARVPAGGLFVHRFDARSHQREAARWDRRTDEIEAFRRLHEGVLIHSGDGPHIHRT